jgi:hypothetical protein
MVHNGIVLQIQQAKAIPKQNTSHYGAFSKVKNEKSATLALF